jgi:predicted RecB family nuclease
VQVLKKIRIVFQRKDKDYFFLKFRAATFSWPKRPPAVSLVPLKAMKAERRTIRLSATDLSNHLVCHHMTANDLAVIRGLKLAPQWKSPDTWILQQHGLEHEQNYLDHLESLGLEITDLREIETEELAIQETLAAIKSGAQVIAQATLRSGHWFGRADVLRRVDKPSVMGPWSYEVSDCKLARDTKAGTILQLSLYSELLEKVQGVSPEFMYVVPRTENFEEERYRVLDYAAYFRQVKARLERAVEISAGVQSTYPEPNPHCEVCRWGQECDARWRKDDHLSLVAGITRLQRKQFVAWNTDTVEKLAAFPLPLPSKPNHGSAESYVRVREQARVQVEGRDQGALVFELIEIEPDCGLTKLPEPSPGDLFLDIEGDPFVGHAGLEYLFGVAYFDEAGGPVYQYRWARNQIEEKAAFEWIVDFIMAAWSRHPNLHVYHFAPYEPGTLKRLMGRFASCEDAIDRMLRAMLFIDLHSITRQAVRASVEQYGLKSLEPFYGFKRQVRLSDATYAKRTIEHSLELSRSIDVWPSVQKTLEKYNEDDCLSLITLQRWLEQHRTALLETGHEVPRPQAGDGAPPPSVDERQQRVERLFNQLTSDVPVEAEKRSEEEAARWLLANLLEWHRRESKAEWWEYYRLKELSDEELLDEKSAISQLQWVGRIGTDGKIPVDRYRFEPQETDVRTDNELHHRGEKIGTVLAINPVARTIDIKKTKKSAEVHPKSVYSFSRPNPKELAESLFRLGAWVQANGADSAGQYRAARDLLLRRPPRIECSGEAPLVLAGETVPEAAKRLAVSMDSSVLAIQGPPGAGKTYTGARMICELMRNGKRVGITALSHKVIRNLLEEVIKAAQENGFSAFGCMQKVTDKSEVASTFIKESTDNAAALKALQCSEVSVLGGTSWLWSREDFFDAVDVLFVDEAGQMSLANVLAVAQAAKSVVLLGDPQQLEQPLKGTHPDGAEVSALEHLLAGGKTVPPDRGLFLAQTWRLHPAICSFTSELFYEERLKSSSGLERQQINGHSWLGEHGLWFIPVEHEGNQNASPEEVEQIAELVESLLEPGVSWTNKDGMTRRLRLGDILIVSPYNAQVSDIANRITDARVGTVDKFQGQETPVVIYSLTTSSPEDAPRGMEFLYSLNRLNVATSRARALCILVGSPRLFEPECRSPRQMQLANALCRYWEMSSELTVQPTRPPERHIARSFR